MLSSNPSSSSCLPTGDKNEIQSSSGFAPKEGSLIDSLKTPPKYKNLDLLEKAEGLWRMLPPL